MLQVGLYSPYFAPRDRNYRPRLGRRSSNVIERPISLCAPQAPGLVETCPGAAESTRTTHSRQAPHHAPRSHELGLMMFQEMPVSTPTPASSGGNFIHGNAGKATPWNFRPLLALARAKRKLRQRPLLISWPGVCCLYMGGGARWLSIKSSVAIPERKKRPSRLSSNCCAESTSPNPQV